jgi:hypothetical protein
VSRSSPSKPSASNPTEPLNSPSSRGPFPRQGIAALASQNFGLSELGLSAYPKNRHRQKSVLGSASCFQLYDNEQLFRSRIDDTSPFTLVHIRSLFGLAPAICRRRFLARGSCCQPRGAVPLHPLWLGLRAWDGTGHHRSCSHSFGFGSPYQETHWLLIQYDSQGLARKQTIKGRSAWRSMIVMNL